MSIDILSIIEDTKKDFTRDRKSVIKDYLKDNNNDVIVSYINKARGASVKFYYYKNGTIVNNDIVLKNAKILIKALKNGGATIKEYHDGGIIEYRGNEK